MGKLGINVVKKNSVTGSYKSYKEELISSNLGNTVDNSNIISKIDLKVSLDKLPISIAFVVRPIIYCCCLVIS